MTSPIYCFFDTETSDLPKFKLQNNHQSQPWVVQFAAITAKADAVPIHTFSCVISSEGLPMSKGAQNVHGISQEFADEVGLDPAIVFSTVLEIFHTSTHLVAHNGDFDLRLLKIMAERLDSRTVESLNRILANKTIIDTMKSTVEFCKLPFPSGRRGYKWPKLEELYHILFDSPMEDAHDALVDVRATSKCFFELNSRGILNV